MSKGPLNYKCKGCRKLLKPEAFPLDAQGSISDYCMACTLNIQEERDQPRKLYIRNEYPEVGKSWTRMSAEEKKKVDPERYLEWAKYESDRARHKYGRECKRCGVLKKPEEYRWRHWRKWKALGKIMICKECSTAYDINRWNQEEK